MSIVTRYTETLYNKYAVVATNFVYDSDGSTDADAGWKSAKSDELAFQFNVATLNATYLEYRIEGKNTGYERICEIANATISTAGGLDTVVSITEPVKYVRVGIKLNNDATPNSFYGALLKSESR